MTPDDSEYRGFGSRGGRFLSAAVTTVIVGVLVAYAWQKRAELGPVLSIRWSLLVYIAALRLVLFVILGLQRKLFYGHFGAKLEFREWFGLTVVNNMASYFVPMHGGVALSAVYLKKVHGFPFSLFASVLFAARLWGLLVAGSIGACVCVALYFGYGALDWRILAFFCAMVIATSAILLIPFPLPRGENRYVRVLRSGIEGWGRLRASRPLFLKVTLLSLAGVATRASMILVGYAALSVSVDILPVLLVTIFAQCALVVSITPGNLGVGEVAIAVGSQLAGIGFDPGLAVAAVIRAILLVMTFGLGAIFTHVLSRNLAGNGWSSDRSELGGREEPDLVEKHVDERKSIT